MKLKSSVIVNYYVTVNKKSNFAHTAHHARRVTNFKVILIYKLYLLYIIIKLN